MGPRERFRRLRTGRARPKKVRDSLRGLAQSELRGRSADVARHKSSLRSGRRAMLRRQVWAAVLLAASSGGFIGSRSSRPALTRRFAEPKRKPGQRGSARAKERLRKALEKEGAPPSTPARERLRERQSPNQSRELHAIDAYPTHRSIHAQAKRWPKSAARRPRHQQQPQRRSPRASNCGGAPASRR